MSIEEIKGKLQTEIIGKEVHYLESVDSTNEYARQQVNNGQAVEGEVIIARQQTSGKGRQGNRWFSPKDKGIYLTFIVRPFKNIPEATVLTLRLAAIVEDWLEKYAETIAQIDPPNDILINGKKVCGILVERLNDPNGMPVIIAGIGVNINTEFEDLPLELRGKATSLKIETGEDYDLMDAIRTLVQELDEGYKAYLS